MKLLTIHSHVELNTLDTNFIILYPTQNYPCYDFFCIATSNYIVDRGFIKVLNRINSVFTGGQRLLIFTLSCKKTTWLRSKRSQARSS